MLKGVDYKMNDRELLEFIAAQVGTLNAKVDGFGNELKEVKNDIKDLKQGQIKIQNTIENDVNLKLSALFDGHTQNAKLLEDIRDEVARHEEVIIKRVK